MSHPRLILAAGMLIGFGSASITGAQERPSYRPATAPTRHSLRVDFSKQQPPFQGWGTSLCWWANGVGGWDAATVDRVVHLITDPDEGLGMNVFRFNIGGGDDPSHQHMRQWGDMPSYKASAEVPYDWAADANQRNVLLKLVAARPDSVVEFFSNSPPYWMTASGCSAGAGDGRANLPQEREADFVRYLVDVAAHYHEAYGVKIHSLEPLNEPDVNWWRAKKDQEGCHVPRDQQGRLITLLRTRLDEAGLASTSVSATDANSIDDCVKSVASFDVPAMKALGQINAHSYAGSQREELHALSVQNAKPLWQSETGPLWVGGTPYEQMLKVAERVTQDVNQMRPAAWCTWQVVAGGEWGCLHENIERRDVRVGKLFHLLASFTRHVRPGDRFVEVDGDGTAAAGVSTARDEAVVVLVNRAKRPEHVRLTLAGLQHLPMTASVLRVSASEDGAAQPPAKVEQGAIELDVPPECVVQLLLSGISK